jgi:hypothetical protein
MSTSVSFGGRPPVRPRRRAAARPAWVRSRIRLRSNSASAPKHVKNERSLRGRRVERFGQNAKPDAPDPQVFDGFDQLLHRLRRTVELPHDQRVAAAREFKGVMQGAPIRDRTSTPASMLT